MFLGAQTNCLWENDIFVGVYNAEMGAYICPGSVLPLPGQPPVTPVNRVCKSPFYPDGNGGYYDDLGSCDSFQVADYTVHQNIISTDWTMYALILAIPSGGGSSRGRRKR